MLQSREEREYGSTLESSMMHYVQLFWNAWVISTAVRRIKSYLIKLGRELCGKGLMPFVSEPGNLIVERTHVQ